MPEIYMAPMRRFVRPAGTGVYDWFVPITLSERAMDWFDRYSAYSESNPPWTDPRADEEMTDA